MAGVNCSRCSTVFAALLCIVASGFTLIFGLPRLVDLTHGALYLFGGYVGYTIATQFDRLYLD